MVTSNTPESISRVDETRKRGGTFSPIIIMDGEAQQHSLFTELYVVVSLVT